MFRTPGIEQGELTIHHVDVRARVIVVKEAASTYWTGLGQPHAYSPVQYHLIDEADVFAATGSGIYGVYRTSWGSKATCEYSDLFDLSEETIDRSLPRE